MLVRVVNSYVWNGRQICLPPQKTSKEGMTRIIYIGSDTQMNNASVDCLLPSSTFSFEQYPSKRAFLDESR
jgi:hypothetical protein